MSLSKGPLNTVESGISSKVLSFIRVDPQHAWILETSYPIIGCKPKILHSSLLIQVWLLGEKHPEESLGLWSRKKENRYLGHCQTPHAPGAQESPHPWHLLLSSLSLQPASAWTLPSAAQGPRGRLGLATSTWHSGTEPGCGPGWQPAGNKRPPEAKRETPDHR